VRTPPVPHRNREAAGRQLAGLLAAEVRERVLVLALPRGGVPLAAMIAAKLEAPLDILVVRKIAAPEDREYGLGAVAEGGELFLDQQRVREVGLSAERLEFDVQHQREEVDRRAREYRGDRPSAQIRDQVAILVDDGLATGGTMRAAVGSVKLRQPRRVVVAVGVASREAAGSLRPFVDELVCPLIPPHLASVGEWYQEFPQLSDEAVRAILEREWSRTRAPR
jgi:predicted phosphoribosyltransferase